MFSNFVFSSSYSSFQSEEGEGVEAAGIVEGMEKVNLEDADFSLELLTQHFKDSTATPGGLYEW